MAGIGGTVADILEVIKLLNNELRTRSGEPDETRAILALTQGQHYMEALAATLGRALQTTTTITTTAATESTSWATSLLRLDAIWYLDANSNPVRKLERIEDVGGHVPALPWPFQVSLAASTGAPFAYYGNMDEFYWLPLPDGTYTLRIYGLIEQSRWSARTENVNYPYRAHLPLATFANTLLRVGVDDAVVDMEKLAAQTFTPMLRQLVAFDRTGPRGREFSRSHDT